MQFHATSANVSLFKPITKDVLPCVGFQIIRQHYVQISCAELYLYRVISCKIWTEIEL
jgi:hypothetical protein